MKIVVLGGSFNPPTLGHFELLKSAKEAVGADMALFVPSPYSYVVRKLARARQKNEALSDEVRTAMLRAMCEGEGGFGVEEYELTVKGRAYSFETVEHIAEKYGTSEVYFIAGSDKLSVFPKWHRAEEFFTKYKVLVASRAGDNARELIDNDKFLSAFADCFTVFNPPSEIGGISSTAVRKMMRENRESEAKGSLHPYVYDELLKIYGIC